MCEKCAGIVETITPEVFEFITKWESRYRAFTKTMQEDFNLLFPTDVEYADNQSADQKAQVDAMAQHISTSLGINFLSTWIQIVDTPDKAQELIMAGYLSRGTSHALNLSLAYACLRNQPKH